MTRMPTWLFRAMRLGKALPWRPFRASAIWGVHLMQYRPDIDGLRAIAVVPIVLFHAGVSTLSGGFIGVDIFFVISGFLITSIIVREMDAGAFSIAGFYRRRTVRIFPALFVMLSATLVAGCFLLLPDDVRSLAASAAAAAGFVSNVYFESHAGYFGGAAETIPLLHTWSLGVEEQFYLFYPLLLMAARRYFPTRLRLALALVAALSFVLSLYWALKAPNMAFYLLPSRAWELALGGLVALGAFPKVASVHGRNALAMLGLALIAAGLFAITPARWFPAPWALLPCLGAALLIAYGAGGATDRLLAARPMRAIGAISYSLYLWHWPIITFYRFQTDMALAPAGGALVVAASLAAASLSYLIVERWFLRRFRHGAPHPVLVTGGAALAMVIAAAFIVHARADMWRDLPPDVRRIASYVDYRSWPDHQAQFIEGTCFVSLGEAFDRKACLATSQTKRNMLVFGDSHAAQYWRALTLRYPDWNVMQATGAACRPMHGVSTESHCNDFVPYVLDDFLVRNRVEAVVLGGRWLAGETGRLEATIRTLQGRGIAVTVIGPGVEYEAEFPRLLAMAMLRGDLTAVERARVKDRKPLNDEIARMAAATGAHFLSAYDTECPEGRCLLQDPEGGPFHYDYGHITLSGTRLIISRLPDLR